MKRQLFQVGLIKHSKQTDKLTLESKMGCMNSQEEIVYRSRERRTQLESQGVVPGKLLNAEEDIRDVYDIKQVIGQGAFGTVRVGIPKRGILRYPVAIKIINKSKLSENEHFLMSELECLQKLDHPNIIKFFEVFEDKMYFYLCMEYCSGGELLLKIVDGKTLSEKEAAIIMKKLLSAINHMHSTGVVHRDIKPENILLSDKSPDAELKLVDFGLSKKFSKNEILQTMVGTPLYVSPEVLTGSYDKACDLWSAGVILYILLVGYHPFNGPNRYQVYEQISNCSYSMEGEGWEAVSEEAKDLVQKLLVLNKRFRFTAGQALSHPWIQSSQESPSFSGGPNLNDSMGKRSPGQMDRKIVNILRNFQSAGRFKQEVMKIIVNRLKERDIEKLKEAFQLIDKDKTGLIKTKELRYAMLKSGVDLSKSEVEVIMRNISPDQESAEPVIRYSEFIGATLNTIYHLKQEKLWSNSNAITVRDLHVIFGRSRKISLQEVEKMVEEVHPSTKGQITFREFKNIMNQNHEPIDYHS